MTGEARPDTVGGGSLVEVLPLGPALSDALLVEPEPASARAAQVRRRRRRWVPRPVLHLGRLLLIALVIEYLVVPNIAGTRKALHLMGSVSPFYLLVGLALEIGSIVAYAALTRTVLGSDRSPGLATMVRIQLTTLSVSHVVPGGSAAGSSLGYRLLTQAGVKGTDVGFALATQGLGSAVVLNVLFWLALVVSIPVWGFSPLYVTAGLAGVALFVLFTALVLLMTRGEAWLGGVIERGAARLSFLRANVVRGHFDHVAARVHELGTQRHMVLRAAGWALANWLLDAASLFVFVGAFGHWVNPDGLLVAYGLANVLAAIPLVPGGLGVVEATLTSALVGFGSTRAVALLGVLAYRFVNFWLPIPVGGLTYLSLQVDPGHTDRSVRLAHLRNIRSWLTGPVEAWRRRPRRGEPL
ncbi:MAG: flippase-like domain-containing protein [Acidimicrobiaceae bacterium]|nr:flippase-like domain-containing protein [Acidimicrobiaceae bacterium]MBO0748213.1 flippase-like domain-containing protein [Acidimicrobiaceae bacterium]